jgi:nucleotide-binding universal stress UspA family protein
VYRSILVPLDGSALAERALGIAASLAAKSEGELRLVHVHPTHVVEELPAYGLTGATARAAAEQYVARVADRLRGSLDGRVTATVVDGSPASSIVTHAERVGADLIVMSSHGRTGAGRFWLGSIADAVIRSATGPLLMVRGQDDPHAFQRILVPLDGSSLGEEIIPHAIALAKTSAAHVHLLQIEERAEDLRASVWTLAAHEPDDLPDRLRRADRYLSGVIARFQSDWPPATVSAEARGGHRVGATIVEVATERAADLIAMTVHGRGASRLLLGSVADKVVRGTECSVLMYRAR